MAWATTRADSLLVELNQTLAHRQHYEALRLDQLALLKTAYAASVATPDYYAYSRAGDGTTTASHKGLMLVLNDSNTDITTKTITSPFKSATLTDKTGNYAGTVTTNSSGVGTFPVKARRWSVWVVN